MDLSARLEDIHRRLGLLQDDVKFLAASIPSKTDAVRERGESAQTQEEKDLADYEAQLARGEIWPSLDVHEQLSIAADESRAKRNTAPPAALTDSTTGAEQDPPTLQDFLGAPGNQIGVHDYNSLVECLQQNFATVFSSYAAGARDPQNMIQLMAAEIQYLRRRCELEHGS